LFEIDPSFLSNQNHSNNSMKTGNISTLSIALSAATAGAFTLSVDPAPLTMSFDDFNDGVDTSGGFVNMASAGEAAGFASINMNAGAADPQVQFPTPGAAFNSTTHPYFRVNTRGTVGGPSQFFPLPPAAPTVVNYSTTTAFTESQLAFVNAAPGVAGTGLRIDPLSGGTAAVERFDFDYVMLDSVRTIGLGEFDHDGALDGWSLAGNGHIINGGTSALTSTFSAMTAGNDPVMQRGGLNVDTNIFDTLEVRIALDPASTSRFEIFWGSSTFPGPAGGQSVALVDELIRDGNLHTYRFDMSDEAAWDGSLNLLRVDPLADADAQAGRSFEIDYIRLLEGNGIPEPSGALLSILGGVLAFARRRR
jgi:hypothetical protein